jgi:hypothetical protein
LKASVTLAGDLFLLLLANVIIDQPGVIKKILQHIGQWEESHAPPERDPPIKEITFDPSYSLSPRLIRLRWKLI